MVIVHEVVSFGLKDLLDTFGGSGESLKDFDNGITLVNRLETANAGKHDLPFCMETMRI